MPQRPPDIKTATFLACGWSPPNVVTSCLLLSYTTKYIAVPSVSRTTPSQPIFKGKEEVEAGESLGCVLTKVKVESSIQPKRPPVLDNRGHGLERPLILVARRDRLPLVIRRLVLPRKQDRDLGAQLRQLKGAGENRDKGPGRGPRGREARAGVERGVVPLGAHVCQDVDAEPPLDPLRIFDLGPLVYGE